MITEPYVGRWVPLYEARRHGDWLILIYVFPQNAEEWVIDWYGYKDGQLRRTGYRLAEESTKEEIASVLRSIKRGIDVGREAPLPA